MSTSIILTRWVCCFIYECLFIFCFENFVFLTGVFIFAETFGILVMHSSGNLFLNFIPDINIEEKFYSSRSVGFFQNTQTLLWNFSLNISLLKFLPQQNSEGKSFILTTREVLFQITLKNIETKIIRFLFCFRTNVVWIRIFQLNQNEWWITDMSENKTYTSWLRALGRKSFVLKILRE